MLLYYSFQILILNDNIEKIKTDQFSLDHELDFIVGQQNELEDMIAPLERELSQVSIRDPEREQRYCLEMLFLSYKMISLNYFLFVAINWLRIQTHS